MTADDDLARVLAVEAGRRLLARRARGGDAGDLRAAGDRLSHEFLAAELGRLRPGDAVLSEEARDDPARLAADRVWIVDPLDGTREYGEPGRSDWAVHVALWERGELTAGAVALPAQKPGPQHRRATAAARARRDGPARGARVRPAAADRGQPEPAAVVRGAGRPGHRRDADAARLGRGEGGRGDRR